MSLSLASIRQLAGELLHAAAVALQPKPAPAPRPHRTVVLLAAGLADADAWLEGNPSWRDFAVRVVYLGRPGSVSAVRGLRLDGWAATDRARAHPAFDQALADVLPTVPTAREA